MGFGYKVQHTGIQMSIANAQVTLDRTSFTYDESQHAPVVQLVQVGDVELVEFQDYVAYITPATDAGDYNVIISGMGDYSGAKNVPWQIEKAQGTISVQPNSVSITGAIGTTAKATLSYKGDGEITFSESDYVTIQRSGTELTIASKAAGSGSVTITLEDGQNYKGASTNLSVEVSTLPEADDVLENNSWETIAAYCAAGEASTKWNVGDTKSFTIGGETYHAQIIGFDHDDLDSSDAKYSDGSYNGGKKKAGITFQMQEILTQTYRMDETNINSCSWRDSEMRVTTFPQIKATFEQALVAVLRTVTKKTGQSQTDSTILSTPDELFLLCQREVFGDDYNVHPGEGTQYAFYAASNSKIKNKSGSPAWWWLRSPSTTNSSNFRFVNTDGTTNSSLAYVTGGGIAAGFCV